MDRVATKDISWAPSRQKFIQRVLLTSVATFAGLSAVILYFSQNTSLSVFWALVIALILTLGFVIEDVMRWRAARTDRWQLDEGQLVHDGPDGRAHLSLSDIESVKVQFGTRVVIKLRSGQRIAIRHLPYPAQTAEQIAAAMGPRPAGA